MLMICIDGNTDEELCNRWMQLSAFMPFYRNHNMYDALPQEPYRWPSVANASRIAIAARYSLLPYWVSIYASHKHVVDVIGTKVHAVRQCLYCWFSACQGVIL
jgi:hypothetical protein